MTNTDTRTLALRDDMWHPAAVVRCGLASHGEMGFDSDFLEDGSKWSTEMIEHYPLVVLAKANITPSSMERPWLSASRHGNGLVVEHGGIRRYENLPLTCDLIGGRFLHHPERCAVTISPTTDHAFTLGVTPFTVHDERYFAAMSDPHAEVFLRSRSKHDEQPAGWSRVHGNGRVCALTPGRDQEVWLHPSFQTLLLNALKWAAKKV